MRTRCALGILLVLATAPATFAQPSGTPDTQKVVIRRFYEEVYNRGNLAALAEYLAPDFLSLTPGNRDPGGAEGVKQAISRLHTAFPDLVIAVEDQTAEGDQVVTRWSLRGTHKGEWRGFPATGRRVQTAGITICRLQNGRIRESWEMVDELGLLQQIAPEDRVRPGSSGTETSSRPERPFPSISIDIGYWITRWQTGSKGPRR